MLTLLQFVTLDSMNMIYRPLVQKDWWLGIYFVLLILIVSIALMNLVTAIVVESALEQAMEDKAMVQQQREKERKKCIHHLKKIFIRLDEDRSGEVTVDEIANMDVDDQKAMETILGIKDPMEIFNLLDVDKSGSLGIEEFCDGIWQYVTSSGSLEMKRIEKKIDGIQIRMDAFATEQMDICNKIKFSTANAARTSDHGPSSSYLLERAEATELIEQRMPEWVVELRTELHHEIESIRSDLQNLFKVLDRGCCESERPSTIYSRPSAVNVLLHGTREPEKSRLEVSAQAGSLNTESALKLPLEEDRHCCPPLSPALRTDVAFAVRAKGPPDSLQTAWTDYRMKSCRETI